MKLIKTAKIFAVGALAIGVAAGCASTAVTETEEPTTMPAKDMSGEAKAAIDAAKAALSRTEAHIWRDTEALLKSAEEAYAKGDYEKAIKLAEQASEQISDAENQAALEDARLIYEDLRTRPGLTDEQKAKLAEGDRMIRSGDGYMAKEYMERLAAEFAAASFVYDVVKGDSLWKISGKDEVYANPYQWPLIYKSNSDKIEDADLIYPGQQFDIDKNPSAAAVDAAVDHAKTRGAWSVGTVEESDKAYLAR